MNIPVDTTFRAEWVPNPVDFGIVGLDETSLVTARVGGSVEDFGSITGGEPPYTILSVVFVGGPPGAGISITQTTDEVPNDTIAITTTAGADTGVYSGTIRAVISDSSPDPQILQVDLSYDLTVENPAVNDAESFLASLNPSHYWLMDEPGPGDWLDRAGSLDFSIIPGTVDADYFRNAPGVARGQPRQSTTWFTRDIGRYVENLVGVNPVGWTTGVFACWVFLPEIILETETYILAQTELNNSGLWGGLSVLQSGAARCEVTWNDNPRIVTSTAAGAITPMQWHLIVAVQRADGNGIRLYVDGVDATSSQVITGIATLDSWFDDIMLATGARELELGAQNGNNVHRGIYAYPAIWRNSVITSPQVLALYNSVADSFDGDATDYFETFFDLLVDTDLRFWCAGHTGVGRAHEMGYIDDASNDGELSPSGATFTPPSAANQPAEFPKSAFDQRRRSHYDSNNPTFSLAIGDVRMPSNLAIGTYNAWVKINTIAGASTERLFFAIGQTNVRWMNVGIEQDRFFCEIQNSSEVNVYRAEISAIAGQSKRMEVGESYMLSVVQDGATGLKLYINGVEMGGSDVVETILGTADDGYWLKDLGGESQWSLRCGGLGGSASSRNFQTNDLLDWCFSEKVLSAANIQQLYLAGLTVQVNSLSTWINNRSPEHWWKTDEPSGSLLDTGVRAQGATLDLAIVGALGGYEVAGPSPDTLTVDWTGGNRATIADNIRGGSTGSVAFYTKFDTGVGGQTFLSVDSANETDNLAFGFGARGVGAGAYFTRLSCVMIDGGTFNNYRAIVADDSISTMGIDDGAYHLVAFTQDGSTVRIYVDNVEVATSVFTGGSAPPPATWFENLITPTRSIMGNGRFASATENWGQSASGVAFILRNDILSLADVIELFDYIEDPGAAIGMVSHTVTDTGTAPAPALTTMQIQNNGILLFQAQNALTVVPLVGVGEWLVSGTPADYDVRLTVASGTAPTSGSVGVWENLGTTRTWNLLRSITPGTTTGNYTVEFSLAGQATPIATITNVILNATLV